MFFWDDEILVGVKAERRWLAFLVARIAIKIGEVGIEADEFGVRLAGRGRAEKLVSTSEMDSGAVG
jgi:hypothetical protein